MTSSWTAAEIAARVGGRLVGDGTTIVHEVASPETAGPNSLCWVGNPKYLAAATASRAGVLLLSDTASAPPDRTTILAKDPDWAVCTVLTMLAPPADVVSIGVHPAALVDNGAVVEGAAVGSRVVIGAGTRVGPGTQLHPGVVIGSNVTIGRDCVLWPNVVVRERVTIGNRVLIHPNASIGADGFGYLLRDGRHVKIPQIGTVVIEDDVEIGAGTTIDRAKSGVTRIGAGTKIDNLVQIGHNVVVGRSCIIISLCGIGGSAVLGDGVVLAGQVGVVDHVRIGPGSLVAARATVWGDLPGGGVYAGSPARPNQQHLHELAAVAKLPELLKEIRGLRQRVVELQGRLGEKELS